MADSDLKDKYDWLLENNPRIGLDAESIKLIFQAHLRYDLAVDRHTATLHDRYLALAWAVRDRLIDRWIKTQSSYYIQNAKRVYYLSMEFLIGRSLGNNVINLQVEDAVREAMSELHLDWEDLRDEEVDAGLGNGGLGRLAACFLESMATMGIPGYGYSLRYEHGIFQQEFQDGFQVERPDSWLRGGNPWEIPRPDMHVPVHFGGWVEMHQHEGKLSVTWVPEETIWGVPYDIPTVGYGGCTVNTLRLWQASSPDDFDFEDFNRGDYLGAVDRKVSAENLTKVLYPNDDTYMGKQLRFRQQYFFVACSISDILRRFDKTSTDLSTLPDMVAIQLNDTHPTLAIPELMRVLLDERGLTWDEAWDVTVRTMAYTNHTLLNEALEMWPADMVKTILPRHHQIICEINHRFLHHVAAFYPGDFTRRANMSILGGPDSAQVVRMANLAIVGSHSVNGVAELHTKLLRSRLVPDFAAMYPKKFNNKTNGVTPRRWLLKANPGLAELVSDTIGEGWITDLDEIAGLKPYADDAAFRQEFRETKRAAKETLAEHCRRYHGLQIDPTMRFDVHCKRIHTYKRQLLKALHIVHLYNRMHKGELEDYTPTAFIFAGKAAPGFYLAKMTIKLINSIAEIIADDPHVKGRLAVHFIPNYRVSLAERLIPAADISEQISVAGTEASGTGNMKFMMNGALTCGTLDGANVEIVEQVGKENAFIFGLTAEEVASAKGYYSPWWHYENEPEVREVADMIFRKKVFCPEHPDIFEPVRRFLFDEGDPYMHFADFMSYCAIHEEIDRVYADPEEWSRRAILNVAASGKFSSDRSIREYAEQIWQVRCIEVPENVDDGVVR